MTKEASHQVTGTSKVESSGDVQSQTPSRGNTIRYRKDRIAALLAVTALTAAAGVAGYIQNRNGGGEIKDEPTRAWEQVHANGKTVLKAGEGATPEETAPVQPALTFISGGGNAIGKTDASDYPELKPVTGHVPSVEPQPANRIAKPEPNRIVKIPPLPR